MKNEDNASSSPIGQHLPQGHKGKESTENDSLYKRCLNHERGRHLVANQSIPSGTIVFVERPLLSLQTFGNSHEGALVCRCCRSFVGGPKLCLAVSSGRIPREKIWDDGESGVMCMVPCRNSCGEIYCSKQCEEEMWKYCGHDLLCTGLISDQDSQNTKDIGDNSTDSREVKEINGENTQPNEGDNLHPLLQFKVHAIQNNEILLMVADLIATVVSLRRQQISKNPYRKKINGDTSYKVNGTDSDIVFAEDLESLMKPYVDFTLVPWWEVVTSSQSDNSDALNLEKCLRKMCKDSAKLLKDAILCAEVAAEYGDCLTQAVEEFEEHYQIFSELFFGKIIGSFEQNAMGIRARHPSCLDILTNTKLREDCHNDFVRCLEMARMIDNDNDEENSEDHTFTPDDIAEFLADLEINEEGRVNPSQHDNDDYNVDRHTNEEGIDNSFCDDNCDKNSEQNSSNYGDDLDELFRPLDGTAMYYTTCKMNHSCQPNIVARYAPRRGWGRNFPLLIQCVAVADICEGEELCISYINSDARLEDRKELIKNYGFVCSCAKCVAEESKKDSNNCFECSQNQSHTSQLDDNLCDLFGEESISDEKDSLLGSSDFGTDSDENINSEKGTEEDLLCKRITKLNILYSFSREGSLPLEILAATSVQIIQQCKNAMLKLETINTKFSYGAKIRDLLEICLHGIEQKNFVHLSVSGSEGEDILLQYLFKHKSWPDDIFRHIYAIFAIATAVGYAHAGQSFSLSLEYLDKASILGLRAVENNLSGAYKLMKYVSKHALNCFNLAEHKNQRQLLEYETPRGSLSSTSEGCFVDDFRNEELRSYVLNNALTAPINHPLEEIHAQDYTNFSVEFFDDTYVRKKRPLVIRDFALDWNALTEWR